MDEIFRYHVKPELRCVLENVDVDGTPRLYYTEGRTVNPGHDIEDAQAVWNGQGKILVCCTALIWTALIFLGVYSYKIYAESIRQKTCSQMDMVARSINIYCDPFFNGLDTMSPGALQAQMNEPAEVITFARLIRSASTFQPIQILRRQMNLVGEGRFESGGL